MKLPKGVTVTTKDFGTMNLPGAKKVTFYRIQVNPGAKRPVDMGPKVYDFCYQLSGTMSVKGEDGKVSQIKTGTPATGAPGSKFLSYNTGKVPAVLICWEIEV